MTTREPISIENGRVEIHAPENRVWLTRHQIADLFGVFVPAVGSNIRSILKSGILREERVYRRERNRDGGIVELYSLEMIAALAFRLKSGNAEAFRRWLVRRATTTAVVWQLPGMNTILNLKRRTAKTLAVLLLYPFLSPDTFLPGIFQEFLYLGFHV